jgi:hypothetical protein
MTLDRDQCDEKNKKCMDLKKSIVCAAEITLMQEKAIDFLKESADKKRAEALKAARTEFSIATMMMTTTVLTTVANPSLQ